jgi:hypothetical protein
MHSAAGVHVQHVAVLAARRAEAPESPVTSVFKPRARMGGVGGEMVEDRRTRLRFAARPEGRQKNKRARVEGLVHHSSRPHHGGQSSLISRPSSSSSYSPSVTTPVGGGSGLPSGSRWMPCGSASRTPGTPKPSWRGSMSSRTRRSNSGSSGIRRALGHSLHQWCWPGKGRPVAGSMLTRDRAGSPV